MAVYSSPDMSSGSWKIIDTVYPGDNGWPECTLPVNPQCPSLSLSLSVSLCLFLSASLSLSLCVLMAYTYTGR